MSEHFPLDPKLSEVQANNLGDNNVGGAFGSDQQGGISPEIAKDIGYSADIESIEAQIEGALKVAELTDSNPNIDSNTESSSAKLQKEDSAERITEIEGKLENRLPLTQEEAIIINNFYRKQSDRPSSSLEAPRRGRSNWVNESERRSNRGGSMTPKQQAEQLERNRRGVEEVRRILREGPNSGQ